MNNVQLIIPMSGTGKRFLDAGYTQPKPLIEVDGMPMVQHVLNLFPGVTDVTFICNKDHLQNSDMRQVLEKICPFGKIVAIDPHKKGPVYTVAQIFDQIIDDKEVIVTYCDYGTYWDFNRFLLETRANQSDGAIACYTGFHPHMLGTDNYAFCREENNRLLEIKEKEPFTSNKMNEFASNGTYYFSSGSLLKKYFSELMLFDINIKGEYYVSLVYNLLVRDGLKITLFEIENMLQWGTPYDLEIYKQWSEYFSSRNTTKCPVQDFTLIMPMAGKGERFAKDGYLIPKPFLPVDGSPMFLQAAACLPASTGSMFVCLREHANRARDYLGSNSCFVQSVTDGQACTCEIGIISACLDDDDAILISACDNGAVYDKQKFLDLIADQDNDVIVWSFRNHPTSKINPNMYSWLDVDDNGFVYDVSCKKFIPGRTHAIIGTMFFRRTKDFLDGLHQNMRLGKTVNGEFYVDDVLNRNIASGLKVKVFEVDQYVCWGTPNDYMTYNYWRDYFAKNPRNK